MYKISHLKDTFLDFKNGNIKCTTTQIINCNSMEMQINNLNKIIIINQSLIFTKVMDKKSPSAKKIFFMDILLVFNWTVNLETIIFYINLHTPQHQIIKKALFSFQTIFLFKKTVSRHKYIHVVYSVWYNNIHVQ